MGTKLNLLFTMALASCSGLVPRSRMASGASASAGGNSGTIPSDPSNLDYTSTDIIEKVDMTWTASASGTGPITYTVLRSNSVGGPYTTTACQTTLLHCTDTSVTPGTDYYYVVEASNSEGNSGDSNEIHVIPIEAFDINLATAGDEKVDVAWDAATGADAYTLEYGVATGSYPVDAQTQLVVTNSTISNLTNGTPYYVRVAATNATGSGLSNAEVTRTPIGPQNFDITILSTATNAVTVSWNAALGATSYEVKYGTTSGNYGTSFSANATSPTVVTGLAADTTYYFMVSATGAGVTLDANHEISATTGSSWIRRGPTLNVPTGSARAAFAFDNNVSPSTPMVVGQDYVVGSTYTGKTEVVSYSNNQWSTLGTPFSTSTNWMQVYASVAVAPPGSPHAGYVYATMNEDVGGLQVKVWDGASWTELGASGDLANFNPGTAQVAVDSSGTVWLVANDAVANGYAPLWSKWDGVSWSAPQVTGVVGGAAYHLRLIIGNDDVPYIVGWNDPPWWGGQVVLAKYSGGAWNQVGGLIGNPGYFSNTGVGAASVAVDSSGVPYVAFTDKDNGNRVTVKKYSGGAWNVVGSAGFSVGAGMIPEIALDPAEVPYVAYVGLGGSRLGRVTVEKFSGGSWGVVGTEGFSDLTETYNTQWIGMNIDADGIIGVVAQSVTAGTSFYTFSQGLDAGATQLGWTDNYPSAGTALTASWTPSASGTVSDQYIQLYSDSQCYAASGAIVDLASTNANTYAVSGAAGSSYAYRIKTTYSSQDDVWSECSAPMTIKPGPVHFNQAFQPFGILSFASNGGATTAMAMDGGGTAYVAYPDMNASNVGITVLSSANGTWRPVGGAGITNTAVCWPQLTADNHGTLYFLGSDTCQNWLGGMVTMMTYSGGAWNTAANSTSFTPAGTNWQLVVNPKTNLPVVAFVDKTHDKPSVMTYDGTNWSYVGGAEFTASSVSNASGSGGLALAINASGTIYAAFIDSTTNKVLVMSSTGSSWSYVGGSSGLGTAAAGGSLNLVIDPTNSRPVVAYADATQGDKMTVKKFTGAAWSTVGSAGISAGASWNTSKLAVDKTGVLWLITDGYDGHLYKFSGGSWSASAPLDINTSGGFTMIRTPSLVIDPMNVPWFSWAGVSNYLFAARYKE